MVFLDAPTFGVTHSPTDLPSLPPSLPPFLVLNQETHDTSWKFRVLNKQQTQIEVQSTLNPKLPISGWVVQMMQNTYQRASLLSMLDLVKKAEPHPMFIQW